MENFLTAELSVSLSQIMFLMGIMTIALLFGYIRLSLFFCYIFVFYWGNLFNIRSIFEAADPNLASGSFVYMGFGLVIMFLALIGFLLNKE